MASLFEHDLELVDSWADAVSISKGYQDSEVIRDLTNQFRDSINKRIENAQSTPINLSVRRLHLLAAWSYLVARSTKGVVTVSDIGGGNGYMYDWITAHQGVGIEIDDFSKSPLEINWNVFESKEIADAYQANKGKLQVNFLENALANYPNKSNLALMSCFLQYIGNWEDSIDSILRSSDYVLIMRVPMISGNSHKVYVQHFSEDLYGKSNASWPLRLFSEKIFMDFVEERFHVIFIATDSEETFPFEKSIFPMKTLFLRRKLTK